MIQRWSLRRLLLGSALLLVPGLGAAEDLALLGSGVTETHDCAGGAIQIAGGNNVYRFTGACGDLEILGSGNSIAVELAPGSDIQIVGSGNAVEYSVAGGGPMPDVNSVGGDNVVRPGRRPRAATVDVRHRRGRDLSARTTARARRSRCGRG